MLLENGYNTFCVGKWHLNPTEEGTPAGPYHRWPLGRGFERFYGFLAGETNQWYPDLTYDNHSVPQPKSYEEGYHLSEDLADKAIQFILDAHVNAPDKPFFMYYATGAAHAPHQVGPEWSDKYKGKFDMGWNAYRELVFENQKKMGIFPADAELSRHDPDVPEWDSLSDDQKKLYARLMEIFAGFLEHADYHFGRILNALEEIGELDNTLIVMVPDNGASSEGGVAGAFNEMSSLISAGRHWRRFCRGSTSSADHPPTTTTRGAGRGPATPLSVAGRKRCIAAAAPTTWSCAGRAACRRMASCGRNTRTRSTWCRRCWKRSGWSRRRRFAA